MCTPMTHAVVAAGMGKVFTARKLPRDFWLLLMVLSILPDADVFAFAVGIPYESRFGHRGLSHSLCFALVAGLLAAFLTYRRFKLRFWPLFNLYFLATASHGVIDALTNGGLGIAFFAPFDSRRYFFSWTPIEVPSIGRYFFTDGRGWSTLWSEVLWVWVPTAAGVLIVWVYRKFRGGRAGQRAVPDSATQA